MMSWNPSVSWQIHPKFQALVAALEADIEAGRLVRGQRLPTHRALSRQLGLAASTITKAFAEATRRGLVVSEVGRGTYVLEFPETQAVQGSEIGGQLIDLGVNTVTVQPLNDMLNRVFGMLARRRSLHHLLEYHPVPGILRQRMAGAKWMGLRGLSPHPSQVLVCNGAQEALMAALATVTRPGDTVLTESLNYAGIRRFTDLFRLDVAGIPTDVHGMIPDELLKAARGRTISAILCSPTLHNPTNAVMPLARRRTLLDIAARLGTCVIENDSYGHLSGDPTPTMTALDPGRCIYICSTSKSIAPGLRIGFVRAPAELMAKLSQGVHGTSWTSPSLMGEIAALLIETGMAETFLKWHREEAIERTRLAQQVLGLATGVDADVAVPSYHVWLPLPAPWRAIDFTAQVRARGTIVSPAEYFAMDRKPAPHAVRISLGGVHDRARLIEGLEAVAYVLRSRPQAAHAAV